MKQDHEIEEPSAEKPIAEESVDSEVPTEAIGSEISDVPAESVTNHEERSEPPQQQSGGSNWLLWLVILLVVAVGGLLLIPNPWQARAHSGLAQLQSWWQPVAVEHAVQPAVQRSVAQTEGASASPAEVTKPPSVEHIAVADPVDEPAAESQAVEPITEPAIEAAIEPAAVPHPVSSVVAVAPAAAVDHHLNQKITLLNQQLARVASSQKQLVAQQHAIATASLRQQVSFLSAPTTGLQQMVQGWQQIAATPGLRAKARHHAKQIAAKGEQLFLQRQQWQQRLQELAKQLHQPFTKQHGQQGHANTTLKVALHDLPAAADSPLTHWLDQQFTLYQLPTAAQQRKNRFAISLQQMATAMDHELWPSAKQWRKARQQISYWLDPEQLAPLPQNFDGVQQQLKLLRQQQTAWLGEVE